MTLARLVLAAALLAAPGLALADEPHGCDAFRWPLEKERSALAAAAKPAVPNGGALRFDLAATLQLAPYASAGRPHAPRAGTEDAELVPQATLSFPLRRSRACTR